MSRKANNIDVLKAELIILKNRAAGAIFLKGKCRRSRFSFRKTDQIRAQSGSGVRKRCQRGRNIQVPECSLGWPALECQGAGRKPSRHVTASSWEGFFVFGFRGASLSIFCADFFFIVLQVRSVKKVVPLAKGGKNGFGEEGTFRWRNVPLVSPL